ncbi:hypothetical protein B7463_g7389, partial [Scytalidium lignicola]
MLADIGEGITECQIMEWFVKPGDRVEQFDKICEVQSDKASVEITSRFDGVIKTLHYDTDDMAIVGKPLIDIDIHEAEETEGEHSVENTQTTEHAEELLENNIQASAGPLESQLQSRSSADLEMPSDLSSSLAPAISSDLHTPPPTQKCSAIATPGVRHLINRLNLDITDIPGTGRDGRVRKEDVEKYMALQQPKAIPTDTSRIFPASLLKAPGEIKTVPLTPVQNQMFKTMTRSLRIPHFLYTHPVDLTAVNNLRKGANNIRGTLPTAMISTSPSDATAKLTALPFIMKALSLAFQQFPQINAHLDVETNPNKPTLHHYSSHNFGLAVDTPQGLLVPVIRNVQDHSILTLAEEINRVSKLAKDGKLTPEDFKGATFTMSNIGSIGGGVVSPVIVAPMVGILGVGRMRTVPVLQSHDREGEGSWGSREEVVLSWSADHRVLDGATVARCAELVGGLLRDGDLIGLSLR